MEVDNQTNNSVGTPIPDNQVPPLNKTKTFSVFAIITCLILLTALIASTYYFLNKINRLTANNQTITTSPPTSEIPTAVITPTVNVSGSVVYFVKDNVLYRLSPLDSAPTVFLKQVDAYAFSRITKK